MAGHISLLQSMASCNRNPHERCDVFVVTVGEKGKKHVSLILSGWLGQETILLIYDTWVLLLSLSGSNDIAA
jgi:hypothetical protein